MTMKTWNEPTMLTVNGRCFVKTSIENWLDWEWHINLENISNSIQRKRFKNVTQLLF